MKTKCQLGGVKRKKEAQEESKKVRMSKGLPFLCLKIHFIFFYPRVCIDDVCVCVYTINDINENKYIVRI